MKKNFFTKQKILEFFSNGETHFSPKNRDFLPNTLLNGEIRNTVDISMELHQWYKKIFMKSLVLLITHGQELILKINN